MRRYALLTSLTAGLVAMLLGGCGGAGKPVGNVQSATLEQMAEDNLTSVLLVRTWSRILYVQTTPEQALTVVKEYWDPPTNHKIKRRYFTYPSGATNDMHHNLDGSGYGTYTKNGQVSTYSWTPVIDVDDGVTDTRTRTMEESYPNGLKLSYTMAEMWPYSNFGITTIDKQGTMTLPDGRALLFHFHSVCDSDTFIGSDEYTLRLPNSGPTLKVSVPTVFDFNLGWWVPRTQSLAEGVFTSSSGQAAQIKITGASSVWSQWEYTAPDSTHGVFKLGDEMAGGGNLEKNGTLVGVLNWDADINGTLNQTGLGAVDVTPLASAWDFAMDRWLAAVSRLSPAPIY